LSTYEVDKSAENGWAYAARLVDGTTEITSPQSDNPDCSRRDESSVELVLFGRALERERGCVAA